MHNLGYMLLDRDRAEAMTWTLKAAQRGYTPAMHNLALLMEDDRPAEAERWRALAAKRTTTVNEGTRRRAKDLRGGGVLHPSAAETNVSGARP